MSICQEEYRRPSSIASYVSTPEQHLAAQVQVYPKGRKIPPDVEKGERRGFIICTSKVVSLCTQKNFEYGRIIIYFSVGVDFYFDVIANFR